MIAHTPRQNHPQPIFDLSTRVAVVIGAASGIGAAVAEGLVGAGAHVVCLDLDRDAANAAAIRLGQIGSAEGGGVDICDGAAVTTALEAVHAAHGRLDVVVSTAGVNVRKPILRYEDEEFDRVVRVNLKGSFHVLRAAGRLMCAAGHGSIILFSSIRSQVVEPGQSVYAATKAGIVQMVRTAAAEFGARGVRVNAIAPGVVETPLTAPIKANPEWYDAYAARNALGRWAVAGEMIGPAVFLASGASSYVTGTVLFVDGGWTAIDGRFTPPGMEADC